MKIEMIEYKTYEALNHEIIFNNRHSGLLANMEY